MPNLFWYICIAVANVAITAISIFLKRNTYKVSTLIVFYLFAAGTAWVGEFIILGLFNSYAYKTGFFNDPWAQNLLGHLLLNTTVYPAVAVVMAAFSLRFGWISTVTVFFLAIEYLFVKQGLYEHYWWRYHMTAITAVVFLAIAKQWFDKLILKQYGAIRTMTFYFVAMLMIHTPAPVLLLTGKLHYRLGFVDNYFKDLYLSSTIIIFFYHLFEAVLLVVFTCVLKKWYWKMVPFVISITVQSLFVKMNVLVFSEGWGLFHTLVIYELFIAAFILVEKYTLVPSGRYSRKLYNTTR